MGLPQHKRGGALEPADGLKREIETLRNRLSGLSEAGVRITEDLDLDTVLQEVVDAARSLTGARISGLTALDEDGVLQAFITSGMAPEDHQKFVDLPGGPEFFAYLSSLPEPLRVSDFSAYTTALGLPEIGPPLGPVQGFLGAPIRHRGRHIGNLYLSDKKGACPMKLGREVSRHNELDNWRNTHRFESVMATKWLLLTISETEPGLWDRLKGGLDFTQEDEDTLLMFASQAAMAITNARRHREEQRARADLETLVNTCPVGVVVFDAKTGAPSSLNREGRRIVDGLRNPDQSAEELLQTLTYRRADGREISLQEFPIAQALSTGETVRAEEIVMQVPDGRSVTTIINATPIRSEEGELESVVVTLQDMTALEELERLRAEFLGMVSHELRGPLTSIKGSAATVLGSSTDMDPAVVRQFFRIIEEQADHMHDLVADLLDVARIETGTLPVAPEPAEVAALVDRARSAFISAGGRNNLAIEIGPDLPLVMADRLRIVQVLGNLLSNAARHSSESSVITVTAVREGLYVAVSVADEGRGIPSEQLPFLFRKFTRIEGDERGSGVLGSGLGLAICKGIVEAHGGRIWAESEGPGMGARFTFTLPSVEESGSGTASVPTPRSVRSSQRAVGEAGQPVRVLAVDDDPQALRYVSDALNRAGYAPLVTGDPGEALRLVADEKPDLVLLDMMLPGADGIELMKDILEAVDVPVIFLSAYGQDQLVARALDMGAVDYVAKPFSPTELAARIRAALRKRAASESSEPYVLGGLVVNYGERRVTLAGRPLQLMAIEYRLLAELSANGGRVLTYEHLLQRVWGEKTDSDVRAMRTIVSSLRRKLGDDADNPTYIFTEPRVGYRMPKGETQNQEEA